MLQENANRFVLLSIVLSDSWLAMPCNRFMTLEIESLKVRGTVLQTIVPQPPHTRDAHLFMSVHFSMCIHVKISGSIVFMW